MPERSYTRRDTLMFLACLGLSLVSLVLPNPWGQSIGAALRQSVLVPIVWMQTRAAEAKTSRARLRAVTAQRDSFALAVQGLPALRFENDHLRRLLELSRRMTSPYVTAEVLHQTQATDGRALLLSAGSLDGVSAFDPVVAPEGLIGMVLGVSTRSSVVMTWAHPEFRLSGYTAGGDASGIVAPSASGDGALEFRGVAYRDSVAPGTLVLSSGLGGVYPRGIPIGVVTGVIREQAGWERVYRLKPSAHPASTSHVLILTAESRPDIAAAFVRDSMMVPSVDSLARPDSASVPIDSPPNGPAAADSTPKAGAPR